MGFRWTNHGGVEGLSSPVKFSLKEYMFSLKVTLMGGQNSRRLPYRLLLVICFGQLIPLISSFQQAAKNKRGSFTRGHLFCVQFPVGN